MPVRKLGQPDTCHPKVPGLAPGPLLLRQLCDQSPHIMRRERAAGVSVELFDEGVKGSAIGELVALAEGADGADDLIAEPGFFLELQFDRQRCGLSGLSDLRELAGFAEIV